jgi:hypothetical protein
MTEIIKTTETPAPLSNFEQAQRQAKALSASDLVPQQYKGNVANTLVALEIANRIGASPLMVMQNLHIIHGRPSWSSTFVIAAINGSGKFTALRFVGDLAKGIKAVATEKATGQTVEGPVVTMEMAKAEGWLNKAGSKWQTMPELMMRYRAAAFFGRLYAPEITMGMHSVEEVVDITTQQAEVVDQINAQISAQGVD